MTATDAIGWAAACVLLTTIGRQVTNVLMLATAVVGQWIFLRNRTHAPKDAKGPVRAPHARPAPLRSEH